MSFVQKRFKKGHTGRFPICPSSYNLVAFVWKEHIFFIQFYLLDLEMQLIYVKELLMQFPSLCLK